MTHASVFSGIGGPEVAATMLGWENLFHCEINPFGRAVLDYWYPNSKSYEDITKTDFTEWRGRVNVLTGGFPCQPFSYAGQRRGATDDRYLWPYMFRCIDQVRPDWVVAENVAGILTMVEQGEVSALASQAALFDEGDSLRRYQLRETFTLQRICDDLEGHGYAVQPVLIPACGVGAPHRRDRVFIVGHRIDADTDSDRHTAPKANRGTESGGRSNDGKQSQRGEPTERTERLSELLRPHAHPDGVGSTPRSEGAAGDRPGADHISGPSRRGQGHPPLGHHGLSSVPRNATHADGDRGREVDEHMEPQLADGAKPLSNGRQRNVADTLRLEIERRNAANTENDGGSGTPRSTSEATTRQDGQSDEQHSIGCGLWNAGFYDPRTAEIDIAGLGRWHNFPSVSPVHRGNDGLPFPVDSLTLPFSKWRTEALKAYGNAIVPQVMYEIFRAIEQVEQSKL